MLARPATWLEDMAVPQLEGLRLGVTELLGNLAL